MQTRVVKDPVNAEPGPTLSPAASRLEVEVLRSAEAITKARDEWVEFLSHHAAPHNAFHHPDIIQHDLRENANIYEPFVVLMRRQGRIEGIAPWYVHSLRFPIKLGVMTLGRVPFRLLKLYGASIVTGKDVDPVEIVQQSLRCVIPWTKEFDTLALFDIPVTGDLWKLVDRRDESLRSFSAIPATPEPVVKREIILPETFDEFLSSLTSKKRNSLRKHERDLKKQSNDTLEFVRVTEASNVQSFLQEVEQVYRRSWQGQTMGGQRASDSQTRFLQVVAERGWFRSYLVRCNSQPVCYGLGYQYDGIYYGEDMAYDIDWRRCAPGNFMFIKLIEDLYQLEQPRLVEFGTGDNIFKQQFSNTSGAAQTIYLAPKGRLYGSLVIKTQRLVDRVYRLGHKTVTRLNIDGWVRERIKRRKAKG